MSAHPFDQITRRMRWNARLAHWRRLAARPLRPTRLRPERPGPANLLLLGVDTLRHDHLGCGGYGRPTSPHLDRLCARGTLFCDVTAPAPWTLPSFASALTGLMPGLHGAFLSGPVRNMDRQPPRRLDPQVVTLAAHLRDQGYRTAAFYSNQFFAFGLAETFGEHHYANLAAEDLAARALDWIRRHGDRPFFCFVLFNDPHEPTTPPACDLDPFLPGARAQGAEVTPQALAPYARWGGGDRPHLGRAEDAAEPGLRAGLAAKLAVYDAAIHQVDRTLLRLDEQLAAWGLDRNTLVSVFADHGEEFTDHVGFARSWDHDPRDIRGIGHGHSHFQELLHVPWAAWGPGVPVGVRRRDPVSLCDLAPTLADWLGVAPLRPSAGPGDDAVRAALTGRSQAAGAEAAAADGERLILAEAIAFGPDLVALRRGRWKAVAHRRGELLALFDLQRDPGETRDATEEQPAVVAGFLQDLAAWRASGRGAEEGSPPGAGGERWDDLDATVRQRLKDLGYSE